MGACCPVIKVKCSRRKVRGKLRCTIRMGGSKWKKEAGPKTAAQVAKLQARLAKKGCRGDVVGLVAAKTPRVNVVRFEKPAARAGWVARNQARQTSSWPPARPVVSRWTEPTEAPHPGYPGTEE